MSTKARELAELSRTIIDTSDATAITINANEEVTLADDLFLADGKKVVFGAGEDLLIFHDGANSHIRDQGTGNLIIRGNNLSLQTFGGASYFEAAVGGAVELYHNDNKKLETTSTGIDVTGLLSTTGSIRAAGDAVPTTGAGVELVFSSNIGNITSYDRSNSAYRHLNINGSSLDFKISNSNALSIDSSSNASFAGTIASGAITSTGQIKAQSDFVLADSGGTNRGFLFGTSSGVFARFNSGLSFEIQEAGSARVTIASGGNATFSGTISSRAITATSNGNDQIHLKGTDTNATAILMDYNGTGATDRVRIYNYQGGFQFFTENGNQKLSIAKTTGNAVFAGTISSGAITSSGHVQAAGALKVTEQGTAQVIMIGNQDSGGTNKPAMVVGVNGYLLFGHGDSWSSEGGTFTEHLSLANGDATFAGAISSGSITSSGAVTGTSFTTTGTRVVNVANGTLTIKGDIGGWAFGLHALGSSNTNHGGFGFLGGADSLSYYYIGDNFQHASNFRFYKSGQLNIGTTTILDSNRNLTNIGTISSGAITALTANGSTTLPNVVLTLQANTVSAITTGGGTAIKFKGVSSGGNVQNYDQAMIASVGQATNNAHGLDFYYKPNGSTALTKGLSLSPIGEVVVQNQLVGNGGIIVSAAGGSNIFYASENDSRVLKLRDISSNNGNIVQFQLNNGTNIWELVGRDGSFYIFKNTGTGSGYKWQIDSSGNHTFTGGATFSNGVLFNNEVTLGTNASTTNAGRLRLEGAFANTGAASHPRLTFSDDNFGIGAGGWGGTSTNDDLYLWAYNGAGRKIRFCATSAGSQGVASASWVTNATIDHEGNFDLPRGDLTVSNDVLVGTTSTSGVTAGSNNGAYISGSSNSAFSRSTALNRAQIAFYNPNGLVGQIGTSGSGTYYNTSSDVRLKDNIVDAPSASADIDAIQVRSFDWKVDGSHQKYGMVAQELQTVAPEAVSAPEDPEEMMGVDYSKLVPMMVKEIQSLRARVAALESEEEAA
jgi:hypothetical protein